MKSFFTFLFCIIASLFSFSQSNIQQPTSVNADGAAPAASAMLDVQATDKGMLVPRMTEAQRLAIPSPANGLLVFDISKGKFYYNNSGPWIPLETSYYAGTGIDVTFNTITNTGDLSNTNELQTIGLSSNILTLSNGGGMADFSSLASKWTLNGSDIYRATGNVGINTTTPAAKLEVENGAVLFEGTTGGTPVSGAGTRLMWIPAKKAFRAGEVTGSQWDDANIGFGSVALGRLGTASGQDASIAGGYSNTASGQSSFVAGGESNIASGLIAFTGGGLGLLSKSFGEAVVGTFNTDYTPASATTFNAADRIFVIGNGANSGARSNAMTVLKSGNIGVNTSSPAASALLDLQATDRGILVPRMTTAQRTAIASPATGLLVFDTDTGGFWFYKGGWLSLGGGGSYTAGTGISIVGSVISNTGDVNAADDVTTSSTAGGDLTGTFSNLQIAASAVGSTEITDGSIVAADLGQMGAASGQVLKWNGSAWAPGSSALLQDADGNTKIQAEESVNEDIIRFDIGGTEKMVLRKNANGASRLELPDAAHTTIIGQEAGVNNNPVLTLFGEENTFLGYRAGNANTTGSNNTFLGSQAGNNNSFGDWNTATGHLALYSNSGGDYNTANGVSALSSNTDGGNNTANGGSALSSNTTGSYNTANGVSALSSNTTGSYNTANGQSALYSNKANSRSTAIGFNAMYYADDRTSGRETYNTAIGYEALKGSSTAANNTGQYNTACGDRALYQNTSGSGNTANGYHSLSSNTMGGYNTGLGYNSNVAANDLNYATAVGNNAIVNLSDKVRIGDSFVDVDLARGHGAGGA
ncbi:MAG: hypothetical protein AAB316_23130, partial [Bacteroidota bacterium]